MSRGTSPSRVIIAGYYGFGNTGDEAVLAGMLSDLRDLRPNLDVFVISGNPCATAEQHQVASVLWSDVAVLEGLVGRSDLVLVGGGGLFQDYWGLDSETYLTPRHSSISFYGALPMLAHWAARPCMLYAVGVGPIFSATARSYTRLAADLCQVVTVRDPESAWLLAGLTQESDAAPRAEVPVLADPAFRLPVTAADRQAAQQVLDGLGLRDGKPFLAVCPRAWNAGSASTWPDELASGLSRFTAHAQCPIVLLPFQANALHALEDDRAVCSAIKDRLRSQAEVSIIPNPLPPGVVTALLGRAKLVLAMRLHAAILGLSGGTSVAAVSYDPKVAALMRCAGLESQTMDLQGLQGDALGSLLGEAWHARDGRVQELALVVGRMRNLARESARLALELLDRGPASADSKQRLLGGVALAQVRRACSAERQLAARSAEVAAAQVAMGACQAELAAAQVAIGACQAELTAVRAELTACRQREASLVEQIQAIYCSRCWRLARRAQHLREWLAPRGSYRAGILRRIWRTGAALRGFVRAKLRSHSAPDKEAGRRAA